MSKYRLAIVNGVLVREKRALLRFWAWCFNRSEEDRLNTLKNNLLRARHAVGNLTQQVKEETERIHKTKEQLKNWQNNAGPPWRDSWSRRKKPVQLLQDVKVARKKKDRKDRPQPAEIARLVIPNKR